ncbi:response regulator [Marinomonas mediterranea]|jgi:Serine phosphatase RsbU, regulator of sigma subunit|uniref:Response regulator receiver modulated serine phosphatase n=1 Tax=Marinomonas mediterranea (strain ATCC 700492 / JCM 21426 / NBRC 103028 / MMB-1) TaxID=717774 RepID=F2K4L2_MARM1|nr:response regulator [Marinomonas mediterranea]ADZ91405.1 response regulator receiver modulated serine phosphatase [Marinomonas mediterranea MMB-1]WCN09376.1 SpoIIE family protein phosphatase [Marinomonas mediterranea]WCN13453.1 SpoIIE family protein phosphatase [Marinomonas mediterranea]WCN17519.1 SpoIIE family protein phosphatase [Marinomonas mediterranea MMB-1]
MKLLAIDSEEIYHEIIELSLSRKEIEIKAAFSYSEALELFESWQPDIVTLEVVVKGGSGLELVKRLKKMAGERFVPCVFLTSQSSDAVMNQCFHCGGDDFIPKPFHEILFRTRLRHHIQQVTLINELTEKNAQLTYYHRITEREHDMARQVLNHIQVHSDENTDNVRVNRRAVDSFNGDLVMVKECKAGRLLIFLGDFTGHGLQASVGALPVAQSFLDSAKLDASLPDLARRLNRVLYDVTPDYMFCAAQILSLESDGSAQLWSGGMPPLSIFADEDYVTELHSSHMPLGVLPDNEFDAEPQDFHLEQGQLILMATDGASEQLGESGSRLGTEGMQSLTSALLTESNQSDLEKLSELDRKLTASIEAFRGEQPQEDDMTFVMVRR